VTACVLDELWHDMSLHVFSAAGFSAAEDLRCRVRADGDARAAGQAQDRTTISYTINEDDRAKAFDVMFALGARGSTGLACECFAALARACRGAPRPGVQALRPAARACAAPGFSGAARAQA
jgi:hypothetical protein